MPLRDKEQKGAWEKQKKRCSAQQGSEVKNLPKNVLKSGFWKKNDEM